MRRAVPWRSCRARVDDGARGRRTYRAACHASSGRAVHDTQAPRLQPFAIGQAPEIEQGFALPVYGVLRSHGYVATNRLANLQFAGVHLFWVREDGVIAGAADPRRDGVAVGY